MFDIDSFGSSAIENEFISDYDKSQIKKNIKDSIYSKDSANYKYLPLNKDKIKTVPSNCQVALKMLDKTVKYLQSKNLKKENNDAF